MNSLNSVLPEIRNSINYLTNDVTEGNVDKTLDIITTLLQRTAEPLFGKDTSTRVVYNNKSPPYYTDECENKRKYFFACLNSFRKYDSDENRHALIEARKQFKDMVRVCKKKYDINETRKIEQARLNNAKDYWDLLEGKPPAKCTNNIYLAPLNFTIIFYASVTQ